MTFWTLIVGECFDTKYLTSRTSENDLNNNWFLTILLECIILFQWNWCCGKFFPGKIEVSIKNFKFLSAILSIL